MQWFKIAFFIELRIILIHFIPIFIKAPMQQFATLALDQPGMVWTQQMYWVIQSFLTVLEIFI